jgi:hypothetical protein
MQRKNKVKQKDMMDTWILILSLACATGFSTLSILVRNIPTLSEALVVISLAFCGLFVSVFGLKIKKMYMCKEKIK